jgi:hypothetical protein
VQTRECLVKTYDVDGVEHTVKMQAESVYEAALNGFERFDLLSLVKDDMSLIVEVHEAPTVHLVKVGKVFGWLKASGKDPAEETRKERLRDQLKIYLG